MNRRTAWIRTLIVLIVGGAIVVGGINFALRAVQNGHRLFGAEPQCEVVQDGKTFRLGAEQMANAATIAGIARRRGLPERAAVIGLATARQESQFRNLSYGDRDSLGLFQQRPSQGWGTPEQTRDPLYASNAFYQALEKVDGYQNLELTVAAQRVQRSAYPDAYAQHEAEATALGAAFAGRRPAALSCTLDPKKPSAGAAGLGALQKALQAEQPAKVESTPVAGSELRVRGSSREDTWAIAQWAVASASRLGIARVYADGSYWDASAGAKGWQASPQTGPNEVAIMLTAGAPTAG
ncbi:MAG: hypothetical protein ACRC0L_11650 [Angustibacter sp.]